MLSINQAASLTRNTTYLLYFSVHWYDIAIIRIITMLTAIAAVACGIMIQDEFTGQQVSFMPAPKIKEIIQEPFDVDASGWE